MDGSYKLRGIIFIAESSKLKFISNKGLVHLTQSLIKFLTTKMIKPLKSNAEGIKDFISL